MPCCERFVERLRGGRGWERLVYDDYEEGMRGVFTDLDDRFGLIAWTILLADIVDISLVTHQVFMSWNFQDDQDGREICVV